MFSQIRERLNWIPEDVGLRAGWSPFSGSWYDTDKGKTGCQEEIASVPQRQQLFMECALYVGINPVGCHGNEIQVS